MKKLLKVFFLIIPFSLISCGDSHESLAHELNEELHNLALVLNEVNSAVSFKDSKGEIERIGENLKNTVEKINALDKPTLEETKKINKISRGPESPMIRINQQMKRLSRMPGGGAMASEVNRLALNNLKTL